MALIGGGVIKDYKFSQAWGVTPSTATGAVVMDVVGGGASEFDLEPGDAVVYSFGVVASFTGVVTDVGATAQSSEGRNATFTIADNRLRLDWQSVFAAFNIEDDSPSRRQACPPPYASGADAGAGGSDFIDFTETLTDPGAPPAPAAGAIPASPLAKRRRYKSLLPADWASGAWTYHDTPFTGREILNYCFNGAWGSFGFTRNYHSDLDDLILTGLDYREGVKLSSVVGDITQKAGLDIRITGARTLVWGRKGTGGVPLPDASSTDISDAESLSAEATAVRVVGDRIRLQVLNVELEPDWVASYAAFIDEVAWRREVAALLELPTVTEADQAELSARAMELTVAEYARLKDDAALMDSRLHGTLPRNHIPVWTYINEFVYRSYRIPPSATLFGIPLGSMELASSLLAGTRIEGAGVAAKQAYISAPSVDFYPQEPCQAIVQGQPLDLIDARAIHAFYSRRTTATAITWQDAPAFETDTLNFSIKFAVPTFIDGSEAEGKSLFLRSNKGQGGGTDVTTRVAVGSDYLAIVTPNPAFEVLPANVKASFCFLLGNYFRDHGGGPRREPMRLSGLDLHVLHIGAETFAAAGTAALAAAAVRLPTPTGNFREILYDDGTAAETFAEKAGLGRIQRDSLLRRGGFTRHGVVGTPLTTAVDRVSVSINHATGVTETVEYAKARPSSYLNEGTLRRIQRSEDAFPGQTETREEIRKLRLTAGLLRQPAPHNGKATHQRLDDVFSRPIGSDNPSATRLVDENAAAPAGGWKAGHLVWVDATGKPTHSEDSSFKGVLVTTPATAGVGEKQVLSVVQNGIAPVMISDSIEPRAAVMATPGQPAAKKSGTHHIGTLCHAEPVPVQSDAEFVLAMVAIGHGGRGEERQVPYDVTLSIVPGETPTYEVTVGWGYVCERIPGAGNAVAYHEAANMWDEQDATELRKFSITVGQAVYIRTEVDADGKIAAPPPQGEGPPGDAVIIAIAADGESSTHYIPKVDDLNSAGAPGFKLYKLAVLKPPVAPETKPKLEKWLTGSHIDHYQELPAILSVAAADEEANVCVIPKEWSDSEKAYKLRAIQGKCGIKATQLSDIIELKGSGDPFRVKLWETTIIHENGAYGYPGSLEVQQSESPIQEFWVLNGVWHLVEPDDWSVCGGGEQPVFDVSWVVPTLGVSP